MDYLQKQSELAERAILSQNFLENGLGDSFADDYARYGKFSGLTHLDTLGVRCAVRATVYMIGGICVDDGQTVCYVSPAYEQLFNDSNVQKERVIQVNEPVSVADMVKAVRDVFGLSVVQVSDILGISRPAVYNHLAGNEPNDSTAYVELYRTAQQVQRVVSRPLKPGLKSVLVDGKSLLSHLKESYSDASKIVNVSTLIERKLTEIEPSPQSHSILEQRRAIATVGKSG